MCKPGEHVLIGLILLLSMTACSSQADALAEDLIGKWECQSGTIEFSAEKMMIDDKAEVEYRVVDGRHIRLIGSEAAGEMIQIEVVISGNQMSLIKTTGSASYSQNCIRQN